MIYCFGSNASHHPQGVIDCADVGGSVTKGDHTAPGWFPAFLAWWWAPRGHTACTMASVEEPELGERPALCVALELPFVALELPLIALDCP